MAIVESGAMIALAECRDAQVVVLSPAVGFYSSMPPPGAILPGVSFAGRLKILNTFHDLRLPGDVYGVVAAGGEKDLVFPVAYGQELFRLTRDKLFLEAGSRDVPLLANAGEDAASAAGCVVTAFTGGIFYTRPGPDAPPFVQVGQKIEKGKTLGLIEVMKTFNHIIFPGTAGGGGGVVKKIYVRDSQEVKLGQPLFLID
jgi:biotin carboxyl carrier protein